ncbi:hypothetical protein HNQ59_003536 [Chitinivorax tropicus]|uniref:Uncharacterized protein n=1 Tax=Chitinivorax tropicus TaxID=714531 RepID=A0A840MT07_9PROT|nr:hypothetical protein [Chitinivorax tropicus]MBB5020219.1 hypothetical protein [Chitinivorax tropicus]
MNLIGWVAITGCIAATPLVLGTWRRRRHRRRAQFLRQYEFPKSLIVRFRNNRPELTEHQLKQVEAGLRQYFRISQRSNRKLVAMPSKVVDELWHEFILHTRNYQDFCRKAFGYFLHHTPAASMSSPTTQQHAIRRAWHLACFDEGIPVHSTQQVPLIFGLDLTLSIAGGFYYVPDCRATNSAPGSDGTTNTLYCGADVAGGDGDAGGGFINDADDSSRSSSGCGGGDTAGDSDGSGCSSSSCGGGCGGGGD